MQNEKYEKVQLLRIILTLFYFCLAENDAFKRLPFGLPIPSFERTSWTSPAAEGTGRFFGRDLERD